MSSFYVISSYKPTSIQSHILKSSKSDRPVTTYKRVASVKSKSQYSAKDFLEQLKFLANEDPGKNSRFVRDENASNKYLGVRIAEVFELAKHYKPMPIDEIRKLLNNDYYEVRLGGVSIMDFQARDKKCTDEQRKSLYELYIKSHERIDNWDLVDRSAPYVVGGYLSDKSRAPLYKLAKSKSVWQRRTAIVSTYFFIRQNDIEDTFRIAELLINDSHDLINKAVGSWIREAGKRDEARLLLFLDKYGKTMPRTTLRYAIEKLSPQQKKLYLDRM